VRKSAEQLLNSLDCKWESFVATEEQITQTKLTTITVCEQVMVN